MMLATNRTTASVFQGFSDSMAPSYSTTWKRAMANLAASKCSGAVAARLEFKEGFAGSDQPHSVHFMQHMLHAKNNPSLRSRVCPQPLLRYPPQVMLSSMVKVAAVSLALALLLG